MFELKIYTLILFEKFKAIKRQEKKKEKKKRRVRERERCLYSCKKTLLHVAIGIFKQRKLFDASGNIV